MRDLVAVLEEGQRRGCFGPGSVAAHLTHAEGWASHLTAPVHALDLGSGGGLPGLVLARTWPTSSWKLLDAHGRRITFLTWAIRELELSNVVVVHGRAEDAGRDSALRGAFDLVTARAFGLPAVTAECGAPFLGVGGLLVVSEPPDDPSRWPQDAVAALGLEVQRTTTGPALQVLQQYAPCPDRYPRRVGIPSKRPLF